MISRFIFLSIFLLISSGSFSQELAKKSLSIDDFASWNRIVNKQISNNGKYVVYEQNPLRGDGQLHIFSGENDRIIPRAYKAKIGSENDVVIFNIKQPVDTVRNAKLAKVKKDDMPKDSLGIYLFKQNELFTYPKVKSFKLAEENVNWLAFMLEPAEEKSDSVKKADKEKQKGDDLILFNIDSKDTLCIKNVSEYSWAKMGKALVYVKQRKDSVNTYSSVFVFNASSGESAELFSGEGWVKKAVLDENGEQSAFLFSQDTTVEKVYSLYYSLKGEKPAEIVNETTPGMPIGWSPGENGKIEFSRDGKKLYLGTALKPVPEPKDTLLDEDKPHLDIWNWKDKKLQPQQLLEADKEKKRTYLAIYNLSEKRFVQLADVSIPDVQRIQKGDAEVALGSSSIPYQRASSWTGGGKKDYYLIDLESGIKREIVKNKSYARLSPQGKYIIWWESADSSYYCVSTDINNLGIVSLTKKIPVSFYNEWDDRPTEPAPYGMAGWSEDDRFVYIYDRYDIWKLDPTDERVPVCVTKTFGRRNTTRLRYEKLDKDLDHIPSSETILLNAIDERTMSVGYFSAKMNAVKDPNLVIMDKFKYGEVVKAKETDKIIWTKQNVSTFPDIWCSNLEFGHPKKISDGNPQQKEFIWPQVELVEWSSFTGETLKGLLYKPENLKEGSKYPMMVYYYERNSENRYSYMRPRASRSTINISFYTSNGYLVFVPDITYKTGYPGQSAYNAVVSGTQYLINKYSFVDKDHIGLQGHSWGGYQTAWIVTQTDMFAAAMAGAPVSNMTSAYGGIRWGSGMSRMFQYEHTQSRIGGSLWDKPLLYIENSPVFQAPKIKTPLLMMHNDNDGAVPWYQGIEMFVALRRLDKPAWLLNYNGQPHNLAEGSWANRIDLSKRMFQFFNHYLKGSPAPEWMEKGVPAVDKGKNLGYD